MAFTPRLTYKGRPLVRSGKEIYYGNMTDPYVAYLQILTTTKMGDQEIADKVMVAILSTDESKPLPDRIMRRSTKNGLYNALDIGSIWLERALQIQ